MFDNLIRHAIVERIRKGNLIPLDTKRKRVKITPNIRVKFPGVSHPKSIKDIPTDTSGLVREFLITYTILLTKNYSPMNFYLLGQLLN